MVELRLICPAAFVEEVCSVLEEHGASSTSVEDADADTLDEQAVFGEPGMAEQAWQRSRIGALFVDREEAERALQGLHHLGNARQPREGGMPDGVDIVGIEPVPDVDWVRWTQSQFAPVPITPGFWIVPSWHEPPASARTVLRLDPGLAFGSGTHPSTRMCLRWIANWQDRVRGRRVLDYGCGSGILGMAAGLWGAGEVCAVDIDPAALDATRANASANGIALNCGLPDVAHGVYDVVLANILATPLVALAGRLQALLGSEGWLVLAGVLASQVEMLHAAYAPFCTLTLSDQEEDWVLLTGQAVTKSAYTASLR
ncbi:50S ribosomal protein L11 methyltransferase [Candidatus Symbiobacter mobilis]|uniref:Ribosomal protein L11 methyltransferase n=1 Tax=Candidatus Symbiobacter mobilis CR TaxID=946483 RepID=U5N7D8_9BURK|nr:50S ribosomal protein L11 methyltransferase [Candidatus Symbiobacter mobilis]AGX87225.1 ribosomal protein L11 methyltransferase [Candidatus Symbiobacter mobilis CR]